MGLIFIIPFCALIGAGILKLAKYPIGFVTLTLFTAIGGIIGFVTIVCWGMFFADEDGMLVSTLNIWSMFIVSGVLAVAGGLAVVRWYSKRV